MEFLDGRHESLGIRVLLMKIVEEIKVKSVAHPMKRVVPGRAMDRDGGSNLLGKQGFERRYEERERYIWRLQVKKNEEKKRDGRRSLEKGN